MFADLHFECNCLADGTLENRVLELSRRLPTASITALGGFPFEKHRDKVFIWNGQNFSSAQDVRKVILKALGQSAILTYTNPKHRFLDSLGEMCLEKKHLWGLHWINMSITLAGHAPEVELAFARDTRFMLSWPIRSNPSGIVFTATAGLKEWLKYVEHRNDMSFDAATRKAMSDCHELLKEILP